MQKRRGVARIFKREEGDHTDPSYLHLCNVKNYGG